MVRVHWRPFYECSDCGERQKIDHLQDCPDCGSPMVLDDSMEVHVCTDPTCDREVTAETAKDPTCHSCNSSALEPLVDDSVQYCTECGAVDEGGDGQGCPREECHGELTPKRLLGWTCKDPGCDEVYFNRPPRTCGGSCNNRRFVRTGLFDIRMVEECLSCEREFLPHGRKECDCDDPEFRQRARGYGSFRIVDEDGRIREASQYPGGSPCYHADQRETYSKSDRYDSMLRGPANAAVTSGRYLLRELADRGDPTTFSESKMLSFADSQSDMKELERNFREPEESFFFDQLFVECVETEADASGWATLSEIVDLGVTEAQQYEDELTGETDNPPQAFEDLTSYGQSVQEYLKEEIRSRILPGKYSERYRTSQLPDEGIVDVRFTRDVDELSQGERELLATSVEQNHRYEPSLIDEVENGHEHLDSLIAQGYLRRVEDDGSRYVMLEEDVIECAVVGEETPIFYAPNEENFITTLKTELKDGGGGLVEFTATPEDRASFSHPHFNLTAQQITTSDPMMLLARAYYGETDREERRELEYQFRQGRYPHFLSSGPAMELGVDIGDLNTLLLYGTPPNANSYLQRIGRAGRESGNSLVHSVSQRNPIDYYYHEHPEELIASDPQQVPLNEVNLEVLHQSLTWAILDWIATTRWIPWRMDQSGLDELVVYRDESSDRSEPRPNDILRFTEILSSSNFQLQSQGEDAPLEALRTVIDENTDEVQKWLRDLIAFGVCTDCGRKHTDGYNGECQRDGCDGTVESILDKHSNLAEGVLSGADDRLGFEEAIIDLYNDQWSDIDGDLEDIDDELSDVRREERRTRDRDEKLELRERKNQLRRRADQLDDYLRRLEDMDFGQYLNRESPAAFGLRSVGDSVEVVE